MYLEIIDAVAQPFLPDLAVELAGDTDGEIRIYLDGVLCTRIFRILCRRHDDVPICDSDVLLEKIHPAIVLVQRKLVIRVDVSNPASVADESLIIIASPGIDLAVIDP